MEYTGFHEGCMPFRYLGIPLSGVYLKVVDYEPLLEKITKILLAWVGLNLSYAERLEVITSVVQGVLGFWLGILLVSGEVLDRITGLCRRFLWGGNSARVAWSSLCLNKLQGTWYGGQGYTRISAWASGGTFWTVNAYTFFAHHGKKLSWTKIVWNVTFLPKFSFILWLAVLGKLPILDRLTFLDVDSTCKLCNQQEESLSHLFFTCSFTGDIWKSIREWAGLRRQSMATIQNYLVRLKWDCLGTSWICNFRNLSFAAPLYYI
ncbi:hypothetical protein M9H77_21334 [Catharanthus roseus]|uniref:Uncharacterized protein n=1 Tax=Catharanthus roseus TaxID=4058 RepID=A0ACC0ARB4_CATRO|nr:hypothetical protein M9H77_21334 [Catharanthus roseus]